jgi:hypothetical protein
MKKLHRLHNEVSTLWNSTLIMIESLLHMRNEVTSALKSIGKYDLCLKTQEWALLEELTTFLITFRELTELVSTKTTSLSLIPLIRAEVVDVCRSNSRDSDELKTIKSLIMKRLDKRLPLSDATKLATLFDPAARGLLCLTDDVMENMLYDAVHGSTGTSSQGHSSASDSSASIFTCSNVSDSDQSVAPLSKKLKLIQKHTSTTQYQPDAKLREEIKNYLRFHPEAEDDDPLSFWKKGKFPLLQDSAKEALTQSASSVPVENMFSSMGLILNGKRSSLASHRANCVAFIHDNFTYYFNTVGNTDSTINN